jgi:hypothetical protein
MTETMIQRRWQSALDAAAAAIDAARADRDLPPAACKRRLDHVRDERRWLARVRWHDLLL